MTTEAKPVKKIPVHFQNAQNRLYIKRGKVVNHDSTQNADIYIEDGKIKYVGGSDFVVPGGTRVIDAGGRYILPGGLDPNTMFDYQFDGHVMSADDYYQGTKAAIAGGTTCIINVVVPKKGESLIDALYDVRKNDAKVCCDYSLIMTISTWSRDVKEEMKMLVDKHGISSFLFQHLSDLELYEAFQFCKELSIVPLVHAENLELSEKEHNKLLNQKHSAVEAYEQSRSEEIEAEYIHRVCMLANMLDIPLYITKVSGKLAAEQVKSAKRRNNYPVFGEILACSVATLSLKTKRIMYLNNPPIRTDPETSRCLIKHLALDEIQTTASNNCTFKMEQKEKYCIPGVNGVADRMSIFWDKCVHSGMIDPQKFVAATSTNAAKIFNLFPKKGGIYVGSDADIVIWNPETARTITSANDHQKNDFNIFEGLKCHGVAEYVIVRGRVCFDEEVGLRVLEGYGNFLDIAPGAPYAFKKEPEVIGDEIDGNHDDFSRHVDFDEHQATQSVSNESVTTSHTTNTHTARGKRPEGQRDLQESSFTVNETLNTPEAHRPGIRVRNPPGGASSVLW